MANTRRDSTSLIRETQIKTMRCHLTLVRMTFKKEMCWPGCGEKGNFVHSWWEGKLAQPPWKALWRTPPNPRGKKKPKNGLSA